MPPPPAPPPPTNTGPPAVLRIEEAGVATPGSFDGTLLVTEILDDRLDAPWCRIEYALAGSSIDADCDCDAWEVTFALVGLETWAASDEVDPALEHCGSPDLPVPGEARRWAISGDAVLYDAGGVGLWEPWYAAQLVDGAVHFTWATELGFDPPEEL